MFKIDQVNSLLDCELCNQLLVDPVTIVCGYSVCKKHLGELLEKSMEENKFQCVLCQRQHTVPIEGFIVNRQIQKSLDIELNKFKPSRIYEECKKAINDAKSNFAKIEEIEMNPESFIYDYFAEILRQVDLRREELKLKADNCSDEIIKSIECSKENCLRLSKNGKRIDVHKQKKELDELLKCFDKFDFEEQKLDKIGQCVVLLNKGLEATFNEYKFSVIGNKDFYFEHEEIGMENIFGRFKEIEMVYVIYLILLVFN